jgi:hypothetical protein
MYSHPGMQAYERQKSMLSAAEEQRHALYLRRINRAARRAERAERQLSRSWSQAARRHAELSRMEEQGPA